MTSQELEQELKKLDPKFSVLPNPNRPGLSNIFYDGRNYDLPVVSTNLIKEEIDRGYRYEFPNGISARYWSRPEIIERIEKFLEMLNSGELNGLYD